MKDKMDIESKLYFWKIIIWIAPTLFIVISGGIVIFSNFKIHNLEKQIEVQNKIKGQEQRAQDKTEIISSVTQSADSNKVLIEDLKKITDEEQRKRNQIIGTHYWMSLSEFLIKFRLVIHCLDKTKPLSDDVINAFKPSDLGQSPNIDLITEEMVYNLVMNYDFYNKSNQCDFTSSQLLYDASYILNEKCKDILDKYAASGNPELIQEIELMANYTNNFIGPWGPWSERGIWVKHQAPTYKSRENAAKDLGKLLILIKKDIAISEMFK